MFENIEKALAITLLALGVKLDEENEQVKKREKRSVWMKPLLKNRLRTGVLYLTLRLMSAPVTMNSILDNAGVLDPLLKFIFKNSDVTQFIILLIIKSYLQLLPISTTF